MRRDLNHSVLDQPDTEQERNAQMYKMFNGFGMFSLLKAEAKVFEKLDEKFEQLNAQNQRFLYRMLNESRTRDEIANDSLMTPTRNPPQFTDIQVEETPIIQVKLPVIRRIDQLWRYWVAGDPSAGVPPMKKWSKGRIKQSSKGVYSKRRKICRAIERCSRSLSNDEKLEVFIQTYGLQDRKLNQERLIKQIPTYPDSDTEI